MAASTPERKTGSADELAAVTTNPNDTSCSKNGSAIIIVAAHIDQGDVLDAIGLVLDVDARTGIGIDHRAILAGVREIAIYRGERIAAGDRPALPPVVEAAAIFQIDWMGRIDIVLVLGNEAIGAHVVNIHIAGRERRVVD